MLFQVPVSRLVVVTLAALTLSAAIPGARAVNDSKLHIHRSQQAQAQSQSQSQRSLQTTDAKASIAETAAVNESTISNTTEAQATDNTFLPDDYITKLLADVDVEFVTTNTTINATTSTSTGEAQAQEQELMEPNVLFRLFYQSWMADTAFSTIDAVCADAAAADANTDTNPVTSLSEVDVNVNDNNTDDESNLAQAAAAAAARSNTNNAIDKNICLRNNGDTGSWVCRTLYDPVSGIPSINSVCAVPDITLATDQCGCCDDDNDSNNDSNNCPTRQEQLQQQCACPCNLNEGKTGVLVQVQQSKSTLMSTSDSSSDRCMRRERAAQRIAGNSKRYACVTTCAQAQQLERRTQAATAVPDYSSFNNFNNAALNESGLNNALDGLDSILVGAFSNATGAVGEGIVSASGGNVSAGGAANAFGGYFVTNADGSPGQGFSSNSTSVNLSSSISVTPAGGNVNAIVNGNDNTNANGNVSGANAEAIKNVVNANAEAIQDVVNADADVIQDSTDEFIGSNGSELGLGSAISDAIGSVAENIQDVVQDFRDTILDQISNIQAAPDITSVFDMNVPGFIGDIFNGIDFQEFLDSLPQQFPVVNFGQNASFGGILQADESGSPGGNLYNLLYQNWVEETLFVDFSTCPAVENERECVVNSQGDSGRWTCRTLFHPVSGTPKSFSICGDARRTLGTDECGCCGGACPTACTCPCNLRGRGEGTGVLVKVGATLDSCMSPTRALKYIELNPSSFQCIDECSSI